MQIARKVAVTLLVCVLLFASVCIFAFTNLFSIVETRFYDSAVLKGLNSELASYTDFINAYMEELHTRFSYTLREDAVKSSFSIDRSREDIYARSRILDSLDISLPEFQWARFVDAAGSRILYSTNPSDQILTSSGSTTYKNYREVQGYIPFDQQMLSGLNPRRVVFDEQNERLVFCYPFQDSMDIRRGEALFAVSVQVFSERFTGNVYIKAMDDTSIISNPNGVVIGIPTYEAVLLKNAIASVWTSGRYGLSRLYKPQADSLAMLSSKTAQGVFVGLVVPEKLFSFPPSLKALLIGSAFITLFVIFFLIINAKQDAVAIVQSRLKELQVSLMHEYYQLMGDMDWAVWRRELEQRRDDVRNELCRGIKIKKGSDIEGYINSFFNRSWDGLLAAIGSRTGMITTFDEAKLEAILSRVLSSSKPSLDADYDHEFRTPKHDDYDTEEFQNVDTPVNVPVEEERFEEIEEIGPETPIVDEGQSEDWEELEEVEEIEEVDAGSGQFYDDISLFTFSPKIMFSSSCDDSYGMDEAGFTEQDEGGFTEQYEDLPELYGEDETPHAEADDKMWLRSAVEPPEAAAPDKAAKTPVRTANAAQEKPSKNVPMFNDRILEKDPFKQDPLAGADTPISGDVPETAEPVYGEFICGAPETARHEAPRHASVPPVLKTAEGGEPVIKKNSRGIDYINSAALKETVQDSTDIDPEMKRLVESVLHKPAKI